MTLFAQKKPLANNLKHILEKTKQVYANAQTSNIQYNLYQKKANKLDTILYEVDLKHHTKTGKLMYTIYNHALPTDAPLQKVQCALKKKGAKNLQLLLKNMSNDVIYGTQPASLSDYGRYYMHLPIANSEKFWASLNKSIQKNEETSKHYIVNSTYYTLHIHKQSYLIEQIIYNNRKKDTENVYERIVITDQQFNLPNLEDLSTYDIVLPKEYNHIKPKTSLSKDTLAPAWECPDVSSDKIWKLSDFQGKVVVLDFWNTTCSPCIKFLPKMKELQTEFAGKDLVFIGMAFDKSKENIKKHLEKYAGSVFYTNVLFQEKERDAYKVYVVPTFFVLDKEHKVTYSHSGTKDAYENLKKYIQEALNKK